MRLYRKFIGLKFIIYAVLILLGKLNKREEMGKTCSTYETEIYTAFFVGRNPWKTTFRWHVVKWRDNVKMCRQEILRGGVDWIQLTYDRIQCQGFMSTVTKLLVP